MVSAKAQSWIVRVVAVTLALPVVVFPYPPMTDFPHHEALVALLKNAGDTALFPPGLYERNLGQPNQLFHLLAWPLSYLLGVTTACKLVAAGAVASVLLGPLRLARHLGAAPLAALALAPVAVGWLFSWGFVNNLLGLGILFAMLPKADAFAESPSWRSLGAAVLGAGLLYLAHELIMFVYVGAVLLFALARARSLVGFAIRTSPGVLALAGAALQIVLQEKLKTETIRMVPNVWTSVMSKVREIPSALVGGVERTSTWLVFALSVAFVAALLMGCARAAETQAGEPTPSAQGRGARARARLTDLRFEILALASLGLYFVAPFTFNGAMLVHERFLAPAYGIAAVTVARAVVPRAMLLVSGVSLPVAALALALPWFGVAAQNHRSLEAVFEHIPLKSSVAAIDLDRAQGGRPFTVASGLSRVLVRRGGRVLYSFAESTVAPVRVTRRLQWNEPSARIMLDNTKLRPAHDLTRFKYVLVHASDPRRIPLAAIALEREARAITSHGEWGLFESTLEVVPLDSPDVPLGEPRPETLGRRLFFIEKAVREAPTPGGPAGPAEPSTTPTPWKEGP